jgi:hypothetical protein
MITPERRDRAMTWLGRLLRRAGVQPVGSGNQPAGVLTVLIPAELLERGIAEYRARNWAQAESLLRASIAAPVATAADRQVGRNVLGNLLERTRRATEALVVYQANVAERPLGSYSYERLARLYCRLNRPCDAAAVLGQAISVAEQQAAAGQNLELPLARLRQLRASALDQQAGGS